MNTLQLAAAVAGGVASLAVLLLIKHWLGRLFGLLATGMGRSPFETKPVMNRGEYALYRQLMAAAPQGTHVLPQVQMSAFLQVRGLRDQKERWRYLSRIIKLSVDFLVIDAGTLEPLVGIELDGPSHDARRSVASGQMDADVRKNKAMKAAGVPLIRIPVRSKPSTGQLRDMLDAALRT